MSSGESTALFKVPTLTGLEDFFEWKTQITDSFLMLGALDIVEGVELMPVMVKVEGKIEDGGSADDKKGIRSWIDRDRKAMAIMRRTISNALKIDIEDCRTAKAIWDRLCALHDLSAPEYRAEVRREILNLFLLEGMDLKTHLDDFLKLLLKASGAGIRWSDEDKCLLFLDTLPASFDMLKFQWRMMPTERKTFVELRRQYNLEGAARARTQARTEAAAMLATHSSGGRAFKRGAPKKNNSDKKRTEKNKGNEPETRRCFRCDEVGHLKVNCPQKKGYKPKIDGVAHHVALEGPFIGLVCKLTVDPCSTGIVALAAVHQAAWIVDSGATHHIVSDDALLTDKKKLASPLSFGLAARSGAMTAGVTGCVQARTKGGSCIVLKDVMHVQEARVNLLSAPVLIERGWKVILKKGQSLIAKDGLTLPLLEHNGLFYLHLSIEQGGKTVDQPVVALARAGQQKVTLTELHERMGHASKTTLKNMVRNGELPGIDLVAEDSTFCVPCQKAKATRDSFGQKTLRGTKDLELVVSDVAGPLQESVTGNKYYVTMIDDYTGLTLAKAIPNKATVAQVLIGWIKLLENALVASVHVLRTDGGGEYVSKAFEAWLASKGIVHQVTPPYTPQHNGIAERKNRTIKEMISAMMIGGNVPMPYWDWALQYSVIVQLVLTTRNGTSAWERLFKRKPDVRMMHAFGCAVWMTRPSETRSKSDLTAGKSTRGQYLGLTYEGGVAVLERETSRIHVSRDVTFEPRKSMKAASDSPRVEGAVPEAPETSRVVGVDEAVDGTQHEVDESGGGRDGRGDGEAGGRVEDVDEGQHESQDAHHDTAESQNAPEEPARPVEGGFDASRKRGREETAPAEQVVVRPVHVPQPRWARQEQPTRVLPSRRAVSGRQQSGQANIALVEPDPEPSTHRQAMASPEADAWRAAEKAELDNHTRAGTWEEAVLPPGRKAVGSRWVYKRKTDSKGQILKYKARVVAQGFSQKPGLDFEETHAPTPALTALRVFVALAIRYSWFLDQMDVEAAFLNSEMHVELYMRPPDGLTLSPGMDALRIRRGLYGFKQSARLWWKAAHEFMVSMEFVQLTADWCIYYLPAPKGPVYLLLYVDDILVAGPERSKIDAIKAALKENWRMSDLGTASWILGISLTRNERGAMLSQSAYIATLTTRFDQAGGRVARTPLPSDLASGEGEPYPDITRYQALVGSLLWLAVASRPDIAFAAGYLGRHNANPLVQHWESGLRVVRYLQHTHDVGLWFPCDGTAPMIEGWADADYAGDRETRRSTTGYVFKVFGSTVSWGARRQGIVATSTVHAEYVALAESARENAYLRTLLSDLRCVPPQPTVLHGDNEGALTLVTKPAFHQRTKHIEVRWHYIREAQDTGLVSVRSIRSEFQTADILTKSLPEAAHTRHRRALGLLSESEARERWRRGVSSRGQQKTDMRDPPLPDNNTAAPADASERRAGGTAPSQDNPPSTLARHGDQSRAEPALRNRGRGRGRGGQIRAASDRPGSA